MDLNKKENLLHWLHSP